MNKIIKLFQCCKCKRNLLVQCSMSSSIVKIKCPDCFKREFESYMNKSFKGEGEESGN